MAKNNDLDLRDIVPLDSACTQHVTWNRALFTEYHPISDVAHSVGGIGGVELKPAGHCTIALACDVEGRKEMLPISNVIHCPDIGLNLLSVYQLQHGGADVGFGSNGFTLRKGNSPMFTTTPLQGLYLLNLWGQRLPSARPDNYALASYSLSPQTQIWHERMGHLSEAALKKLQKMATGIDLKEPWKETCTCEPCVYGRMKETPHTGHVRRGEYPMELIHSDLAGPFPVTGYAGQRYWITFMDDFTRVSEVEALKSKNDAFVALQRYLTRKEHLERLCRRLRVVKHAEERQWMDYNNCTLIDAINDEGFPKELQRETRRLRVDLGGEYKSTEMANWMKEKGITAEVTTTEQHEQNGVAERLNRVLMDKLHPMLLGADIDKIWWPEALRTANYLRNRSPTAKLSCTPYEMWFKDKPDLSHIRVFGCTAYALKTQDKRKKLKDTKAYKGKLLGYEGNHIFRLLLPNDKLIRSSNVHFQESKRTRKPDPPESNKKPRRDAVEATDERPSTWEAPEAVGALSPAEGDEIELGPPDDQALRADPVGATNEQSNPSIDDIEQRDSELLRLETTAQRVSRCDPSL